MAEVRWAAEHGFKGLTMPNKPIFGPLKDGELQYNDKSFEPLWSLIEEVDPAHDFSCLDRTRPAGSRGQWRGAD